MHCRQAPANVSATLMEEALKTLDIAKIGIDAQGRLVVYPKLPTGRDFAFIYRAAMEVNWDAESKFLFAPIPREWSQVEWFKQIFRAARGEYGISLFVSDNTKWEDISPDDRNAIEAFLRTDGANGPAR
jgi:Integron Cassette Protein Hfx_Cass5